MPDGRVESIKAAADKMKKAAEAAKEAGKQVEEERLKAGTLPPKK